MAVRLTPSARTKAGGYRSCALAGDDPHGGQRRFCAVPTIYRQLDPEWWARLRVRSPSYGGHVAFARPTHRYFCSDDSFHFAEMPRAPRRVIRLLQHKTWSSLNFSAPLSDRMPATNNVP
jgi:hypothetical protein